MIRIAINGLGRIGKSIARLACEDKNLQIVAINELNNNIENIAYVINYDTTYGALENKFKVVAQNKISKKILPKPRGNFFYQILILSFGALYNLSPGFTSNAL